MRTRQHDMHTTHILGEVGHGGVVVGPVKQQARPDVASQHTATT